MKKRIMLILLSLLLVLTLVGYPVLAKDPDNGAQGQPFQELWDAIDEAVSTLQGQIDEAVSDLDQLIGDIDSIVQGKVDEAIATLAIDWSQITGIPSGLDDGDDVGITSETDPTVTASVKDGVSWSELSGIPAGFADDIDNEGVAGDGHSLDAADGDPVDAVYVDNNGNVGIGTTSPSRDLDIDGDAQANRYYDRDNTAYYVDPAFISTMNTIEVDVARAERFHDLDDLSYFVDPASTSYLNDVRANIYYDRDNISYHVDPAGISALNDVRASIYRDRDNTAYYVDPALTSYLNDVIVDGKVGIGTLGPSAKLDISQGFSADVLLNLTNGSNAGPNASTLIGLKGINGSEYVTLDIKTGAIASSFQHIALQAGGSQRDSLILQPDGGNVGIGTVFPNTPLDVNGEITATRVNIRIIMHLAPLSSAPISPQKGDIYYDNGDNKLKCWDGSTWQSLW